MLCFGLLWFLQQNPPPDQAPPHSPWAEVALWLCLWQELSGGITCLANRAAEAKRGTTVSNGKAAPVQRWVLCMVMSHYSVYAVVLWKPSIFCQLLSGTSQLQPLIEKCTGTAWLWDMATSPTSSLWGQHLQVSFSSGEPSSSHFVRLFLHEKNGREEAPAADTQLSNMLKLDPVLLRGSDGISLQRIGVWHSQSVVHIGSVSAELFLTTKNISERVTICCNHIFPVFLCDNYSHKYRCFTSAQQSALYFCAQSQPSTVGLPRKDNDSIWYYQDHSSYGAVEASSFSPISVLY